ncbi:MAG: transporter related protein [Acidimicrobiales bacterium]|nr:transporter related protein [Acidimicrobiales bacterium]
MGMMFGGGMAFRGGNNEGGFGGIPPELAASVAKLTEHEPEPKPVDITFVHSEKAWKRPLTFRGLLAAFKPAMIGIFVLVVLETFAQQAGPRLVQYALDHGIVKVHDFGVVEMCVALYLLSVVLAVGAGAARIMWSGRLGERILYRLRVAVFTHLQRLGLDFYTQEAAGVVMTRMTSDVEALQILFQEGFVSLLIQLLTLLFVTVMLFSMNVQLALIVTLGVVPILFALTWWFRVASDRGYMLARDRVAALLANLQENLAGMRVVTAYNRQRRNYDHHRQLVGEYNDANLYTAKVAATYGPGTESLGVFAQAVLLFFGGRMVLRGDLEIGELTAFVLYLSAFFQPIAQLVQLYNSYQQGRTAMVKLRELFAVEPTVVERPDAQDLPPLRGDIEVRDVTFGYLPDKPVLTGANLHFSAGETIAFVGPTGAGKSTIAKLLTRFYDPQQGSVLVDGQDVRDVTLGSLRSQLGIVPQEGFLFAGTIRDNIRFGRPGATDEEIMAACRAIGVDDFIERLPEGLDTPTHERGVTMSSGERQLVALARALMADPRVLILDEATSNLDLATEAMIERALDVLLEGRTAILIAHRLNTAKRADRIVVVDHGGIAGVGRHEELLETCPTYVKLHAAWSAGSVAVEQTA